MDRNIYGESAHELSIVASEEKQGDGGSYKSVNMHGNLDGDTFHQPSMVASEENQRDGG